MEQRSVPDPSPQDSYEVARADEGTAAEAHRDLIMGDTLTGLALACGAIAGVSGAFGIPVLLFAVPLSFGGAGLILSIGAGLTAPDRKGMLLLAVIGSAIGLLAGYDGYDQYQDVSNVFGE